MTAAGEQVLAYAYTQLGVTEDPPNSNNVVYWEPWGGTYGAWCAAFVSYCDAAVGYPLPPIDGDPGFSYCPSGQIAAFTTGHAVDVSLVEPGDTLIFSWEPFYYGSDSVAYCSYGVYAGAPAGDHTGFFSRWQSDGYMVTVEGNTSQSSWDNGGSVLERFDRHTSQICCYARHAALNTGSSTEDEMTEDDFARIAQIVRQQVHEEVLNLWRADEMRALDIDRAHVGAHDAGVGVMRSDENANIIEAACRRAMDAS